MSKIVANILAKLCLWFCSLIMNGSLNLVEFLFANHKEFSEKFTASIIMQCDNLYEEK